jgi:heme oxygenase
MSDMLNRLRAETRDCHNLIESNPLHSAIMDGSVTRDSYQCLLQRMYGVHQCFERWAGSRVEWSQFGFNFEQHRQLPMLERDLIALGAPPDSSRLRQTILPLEHAEFPFILGYLYVLEGSTLGGQILSRLITQHLGLQPDSGGAYFNSYGPLVGARWRSCLTLLSDAAARPNFPNGIVQGARDAFQRIDALLRAS